MSTEWGRAVVRLRCRCADIFSALMAKAQTIGRNETRPPASRRSYPGNRRKRAALGQSPQSENRAAVPGAAVVVGSF